MHYSENYQESNYMYKSNTSSHSKGTHIVSNLLNYYFRSGTLSCAKISITIVLRQLIVGRGFFHISKADATVLEIKLGIVTSNENISKNP